MLRPRSWTVVSLTVLAALAVGSRSCAQSPKGPGGPRGMFGGGMFAGGMFGSSAADLWGRLLRLEQVQKDLQLADDQKAKLKEIGEKAWERMRQGLADMKGFRDMNEDERKAAMTKVGDKARAQAEQLRKEIEGVLTPQQVERVKQLVLQIRGVAALDDKEVQEALGITAEQKEKFKAIRDEIAEKARGLWGGEAGDRQERLQAFQKTWQQSQERTMAVLSQEQRETFDKMKGPKPDFDLPAAMRQGMRRGGGQPKQGR